MGIGMAIILDRKDIEFAGEVLNKNHEDLLEIGTVTAGKGIVESSIKNGQYFKQRQEKDSHICLRQWLKSAGNN